MAASFDMTVKIDLDGIKNNLNTIKAGLGDRALVSALNKTAAQAKTQMSRYIREDYVISAELVRDRLRIRKATKGGLATFTALLIGNPETGGEKRSINLIHFLEKKITFNESRRRFKKGTLNELHFKVKKRGGKQVLPGAFIGNKGRTMFIRTGDARLPIKAVRSIGVPQMFSTKKNVRAIKKWIGDNFPRIADKEVRFFLTQATRK